MDAKLDKKWIESLKQTVWILGVFICLTLRTSGCAWSEEMMANVGGSVGWEESWENKSDIRVTSREYTDGQGNNIIYYCCRTTYFDESQMTGAKNQLGVDQETLKMVIDLEQVSDYRQCKVGEWPAVLCEKDGYTYLCWTISSEYSCVIKYDAAVVTEQEIWRMAESVAKQ